MTLKIKYKIHGVYFSFEKHEKTLSRPSHLRSSCWFPRGGQNVGAETWMYKELGCRNWEQHLPPLSHCQGIKAPKVPDAPGKARIPYSHLLLLSFLCSGGARWPVGPHLPDSPSFYLGIVSRAANTSRDHSPESWPHQNLVDKYAPLELSNPQRPQLLTHHCANRRNIPALCIELALIDQDKWSLWGPAWDPGIFLAPTMTIVLGLQPWTSHWTSQCQGLC